MQTNHSLTYTTGRTHSGTKIHRTWSYGVQASCGVRVLRTGGIFQHTEARDICAKCFPALKLDIGKHIGQAFYFAVSL